MKSKNAREYPESFDRVDSGRDDRMGNLYGIRPKRAE